MPASSVPWCPVIIVADQMVSFNLSLAIQTFTWLFFTNVFQLIDLQLQSTGQLLALASNEHSVYEGIRYGV